MRATAVQSLGKVRQQWAGHSAALTQAVAAGGAQDDALQKREKLAKQCLRVLGSFTKMVPSFEEAKPELEALYQAILQQVPVLMRPYPAVFVRMSECALAGLDEHALDFRVYLPHFLEMFTTAMLELPVDREALQAQPKTLMISTRFLARAMLNPAYNPARMARLQPRKEWEPKTEMAAEADATVTSFFSDERVSGIVHSIVNKYLPLTPVELEEWEQTPEQAAMNDTVGLLESVEVGDAESPRPCGHALFLCLAVRRPQVVSQVVLSYAQELQERQPVTQETWVLRDACYHAIGSCAGKMRGLIEFNAWYASELRGHLDAPVEGTELLQRVLQARSLWLFSQFATGTRAELSDETKRHGLESVVRFMHAADLKLALTAARVFYLLIVGGPSGAKGIMGTEQLEDAANAAFTGQALGSCFHLLQQLHEVENIVVVLRLLALFVLHSGEQVIPHFDALATALPQAWQAVETQTVGAAETRAHAVMLNVVASLLRRLKMAVLTHPALAQVVLQLIRFATDPTALSQGREELLDDGLTLWYSSLRSYDEVGPELLELVGRLPVILAANREPCKGLLLLEAYVLLGGEPFMQAHGAAACEAVGQFLVTSETRSPKEQLLAGSVCDNFLQMHPVIAAPLLKNALLAMAEAVASGRATGLVAKTYIAALCRLVMVDASALTALCGSDLSEGSLVDTFLTKMLQAHQRIERGWAGMGETRREVKLVALALCALLGAGHPLVWRRLSTGMLTTITQASQLVRRLSTQSVCQFRAYVSHRQEARGNRTPPRPDLEQVRAKDGKLAAMQLQLTLNDQGASPSPLAAAGLYAHLVRLCSLAGLGHACARHAESGGGPCDGAARVRKLLPYPSRSPRTPLNRGSVPLQGGGFGSLRGRADAGAARDHGPARARRVMVARRCCAFNGTHLLLFHCSTSRRASKQCGLRAAATYIRIPTSS